MTGQFGARGFAAVGDGPMRAYAALGGLEPDARPAGGAPDAIKFIAIPSTPTVLSIGGSQSGVVDTLGDHDVYQVTLVAGQNYVFEMKGSGGSPLVDTYLELYDDTGTLISLDDDSGANRESLLSWTATTSGTFYINAMAYDAGDQQPDPDLVGGYIVTAAIGAPQNPVNTVDLGFKVPSNNVTVYFANTSDPANPFGDKPESNWTQAGIDAVFAAFNTYSALTNLTFTQVGSAAGATFIFQLSDLATNTLGYVGTQNGIAYGAFDYLQSSWTTPGSLSAGGQGFVTLIHEIGHGLGLAHPHGGGQGTMQGVVSEFNSYGTFQLNQGVFTTMGYNDGWPLEPGGPGFSLTFGSQSTPMPLDIALLQQKYGVDLNTNSGNNAYTLPDNNVAGTSFVGLWDAGGTDSLSYSGSRNAVLDLRAATLLNAIGGGGYVSYAAGVAGGYVIAAGVTIENATGGAGNDTITGNDANNILTGNAGNDVINGGAGNDTLSGGDGNDVLNDTQGFNSYDGGTGTDFASISLASETGNLVYTVGVDGITRNGAAYVTFNSIEQVSITGGSGADHFTGGSLDDYLDGGAGADVLVGGLGNDTYGVDSLSDSVTELLGQGNDTIQTSLTNVSLASYPNFENITHVGSTPFVGVADNGVNIVTGGSGNDYVYAYDGNDTGNGGAGIDVFIMGNGDDTVNGGDGQDYEYGDAGNDTLNGDAGVDVLLGGEGNDTMHGGDDGDYFYGENGDDTGYGEGGNDIFVMAAGNDTAFGGDGQDYFYMGDGNDTLNGGNGVDVMLGEAGNDTFIPGLGVDYVFMGTGDDTLVVDKTTSGVTVLYDFTPGAASNDIINLTGTGWTSLAQVQANISDFTASGGFCILTLDADTAIWFIGVQPSQLTAGDFVFGA